MSRSSSATPLSTGVLHTADCLDILRSMPDACIDVCYLDPPFNTGRTQQQRDHKYADTWDSMSDYLAFMRERIIEVHRVLASTGAILLHCDWRTCHHLRILLDGVFGAEHFVNHLIWAYGLGGSSPRRFARKHDDILFYGRTAAYHFSPPMVPATSRRMNGQMKKATDVIDIPAINNMAAERLGYPTQKPLALLELLLGACCRTGGVVLDPFCGSGTTLEAAERAGLRWVGIDENPDAINIARQRLARLKTAQNRPKPAQTIQPA